MKAIALLSTFVLLLINSPSFSQDQDASSSDNVRIFNSDIRDFDGIEISSDFRAFVNFSDSEESVRLEVDERIADRVVVEKVGSTLVIRLAEKVSFFNSYINGRIKMDAYITTNNLEAIRGKGDAEIMLEDQLNHPNVRVKLTGDSKLFGSIQTDRLNLELMGDSKMELKNELKAQTVDFRIGGDAKFQGHVESENFNANLSGDSKTYLKGGTKNAIIEAIGDSDIEGYEFEANQLDLLLKSDGEIHMTVAERLRADLSGDTKAYFKGSAKYAKIDAIGDSRIEGYDFKVDELDISLRSDSKAQLTVNKSIKLAASGDGRLKYRGNAVISSQQLSGDAKIVKLN